MPKGKRKQKQHGDDDGDSDGCKHINKLPANHLEKMLESKNLKGCEDCQGGKKKGKQHGNKVARPDDLWVCLTCGAITCGISVPQFHARQHYAYYNKHFVVANLKTLEVRCFECALNIKVDDSDKYKDLRQCLNVIKKVKGLEVDDDTEDDAKESKNEEESHEEQRGKNNKQNQKNQGKKGSKQQQTQSRKGRQGVNDDIELTLANEVAHLDISNDMTSGIKGLKNLGNTCFFNSIMQNLAHTIPLREKIFQIMGPIREEMKTLEKPTQNNDNTKKDEKSTSESETASTSSNESTSNTNTNETPTPTSNETSTTPTEQKDTTSETKTEGAKDNEEKKTEKENKTEETKGGEEKKTESESKPSVKNNNNAPAQPLEGPLTKSFKDFMVNMWHGKGNVFSPQSLFLQIKKKAPRFSTMRQQDAQELLRYLLDGISSEERIVFQVEAAKREMANFPSLDKLTKEQQLELKKVLAKVKAKPPPSLIEQLFEGQLESTITCHHCGHKSRVIEPILDLSLSLESPASKKSAEPEVVTLNKKQRQRLLREKQLKEKQAEEQKKKEEEEAKKKQEEAQNNSSSENGAATEAPKVDGENKTEENSTQSDTSTNTADTKIEGTTSTEQATAADAQKDETMGEQQPAQETSANTEAAVSEEKKAEVPSATSTEPKEGETKTEEVTPKDQAEEKSEKSETTEQKSEEKSVNKNETSDDKNTKSEASNGNEAKDKSTKNNKAAKVETAPAPKNDWDDLPEDTVPPMMSQVDGRHVKEVPSGCSIQSTIYAFTAPELLDRDNAFSCYNCTKLHWAKYNKDLTPLILAHGDPPEIEEIKKKLEQTTETKEEEVNTEHEGGDKDEEEVASGSTNKSNPFSALTTDSDNKMDVDEKDKKEEEDEKKEHKKAEKLPKEIKSAPKPKIPLLRRTATKQFLFKKQPEILTLHIKRFMQTHNGFQKISTFVEFPAVLDLTPYLSETCDEQEKRYKYKLYGIVSHSGGLNSGHYVAYVRNRRVNETLDDAINAGWHYFSDTQFHELRFEEVLRREAYMLFYERFEDNSAEDKDL